jgi:hypothetical protein
MKTITIAGASFALILGLTACSGGKENYPEGKISDATASAAAAPASSGAPVETAPAPEPTPTEEGPAKFGQTFTYPDSIAISVAKPVAGTTSEYAYGAKQTAGNIRILTVTITNNTKKVFDPSQVTADLNYGPDGTAADRVFDSAQLGEGFDGKILPGKKQVAKMAFAVPAGPQELLFSIAPSFSHDDALFMGEAVK